MFVAPEKTYKPGCGVGQLTGPKTGALPARSSVTRPRHCNPVLTALPYFTAAGPQGRALAKIPASRGPR